MTHDEKLVEAVMRAIATADEQNGGPPYDALMRMGKHVVEPLRDRATAALDAVNAAGYVLLSPEEMNPPETEEEPDMTPRARHAEPTEDEIAEFVDSLMKE